MTASVEEGNRERPRPLARPPSGGHKMERERRISAAPV